MTRSDALPSAPPSNYLLSSLPIREYNLLRAHLERVHLPFKAVLHEPGQRMPYLYFPVSGLISLLDPPDNRPLGLEVAVVGREGMTGLPVFLGTEAAFTRSLVQVPGEALRLPADKARSLIRREGKLHGLLLRYVQVFLSQMTHWSSCNSLHSVEKRLCRRLLTLHDRAATTQFSITHELLAALLGVRRASVTVAARRLRQAGLIDYTGGRLTVLDPDGLEASACTCYRKVKDELGRLLA